MSGSLNPLLEDDDDEEFFSLGASFRAPNKELEAPALDLLELPALPDVVLPAGIPEVKQANDAFSLSDDSLSLDEAMGEFLEATEGAQAKLVSPVLKEPVQESEEPFDPVASLLDSLGDLERLDEGFEGEPAIGGFDSMTKPLNSILESEDEGYGVYEGRFIDLDKVVTLAIDLGASDIHLNAGDEVAFTILGQIYHYSDFGVLDSNMTDKLQKTIISYVLEDDFIESLELDTSYVVKTGKYKGRRLRLSVGKSEGDIFMVFRIIAAQMPKPDAIGIPKVVQDWFKLPKGLILVNGSTGSGKSTSLSSLMQEIQFNERKKIITLEKPIEYIYGKMLPGQKALITQREIGRDARSFKSALVSAMRQAPDVILVGEVRYKEEIDELLTAAETGHLSISTLHTTSCAATINRIRSMYDGDDQLRVLATLADSLVGIMTQVLVLAADGKSRVAVREVLEVDAEVKQYVLNGDVQGVREYMERRESTIEHELVKAFRLGLVTLEAARAKAPQPLYFDQLLDG